MQFNIYDENVDNSQHARSLIIALSFGHDNDVQGSLRTLYWGMQDAVSIRCCCRTTEYYMEVQGAR